MRRLLLGLLIVAAAVGCRDQGAEVRADGESAGDVAVAQLVRRDWRIEVITDASGDRRDVAPDYDAVLRFDGEGGFSAKTCNHTGGDVTVDAGRLTWGREIASTAAACLDEDLTWIETTLGSLFRGSATWTLADGRLHIRGNGVAAELSERPVGFPTELVQLATSDPDGESEWQFGYAEDSAAGPGGYRFSLTWEGRSGPGRGYGSSGMVVDPEVPMDTMWVDDVDGRLFPFGTLPVGAAAAVFESVDGTTEALQTHELPDGRRVYGETVEAGQGQVVAVDGAGHEMGRGRVVPV